MDVVLIVVTLISLALAATMTVVAWRLARDERRRSEARVAALTAALARASRPAIDVDLELRPAPVAGVPLPAAPPGRSWLALGLVAALAIVGALAALAVPLGGGVTTETPAVARAATPEPTPLELVALGHDRSAGELTIHGIVRNPGRRSVPQVTAVVSLFDRTGAPLSRVRAGVQMLGPDDEAPFAVTVPDAGLIGRYRVSFFEGSQVVPHVDKRAAGRPRGGEGHP